MTMARATTQTVNNNMEISVERYTCYRCGTNYSKQKRFFPTSYAESHKGVGYCHICQACIGKMYDSYLKECKSLELATKQMCRKLDIYWSKSVFDYVKNRGSAKTMMSMYITRLTQTAQAGKSYDDTLREDGILWDLFKKEPEPETKEEPVEVIPTEESKPVEAEKYSPTQEEIDFWGEEYLSDPDMYKKLEGRRSFWAKQYPNGDMDIGTEAIIRQICNLEVDINRDRAAGKPIDKNVNTLNALLGSANLKPAQKKDDADAALMSTPLGVWLYKYENERPLPEIDEDLKDVNGLKKYIFTWMGHLCKMLGVKNGYTRMYEEEIARLRVEKPEFDEEDDESLLIDAFSSPSQE